MNYNTYPYGIFNPQYLSQFQAQQMEAQRNLEQQKNIHDMVKAISDLWRGGQKSRCRLPTGGYELLPCRNIASGCYR